MTTIREKVENYNSKVFLGIDPGETTGWAMAGIQMIPITPKKQASSMSQVKGISELVWFLENLDPQPDVIVYERYVVDLLEADINTGEHETIQVIGVVMSYAIRNGIELVGQLRTVKTQGYAWHHTIRTPGIKSVSHKRDAHAHLCYYQTLNGTPRYYKMKRPEAKRK